jgi:hypothetical protein
MEHETVGGTEDQEWDDFCLRVGGRIQRVGAILMLTVFVLFDIAVVAWAVSAVRG